jgi:hypothetical protein
VNEEALTHWGLSRQNKAVIVKYMLFTGGGSDNRRSSVLHFERKYFEVKQFSSFRPSKN